ncbi:MAG: rRNA adenine N-6-methyltransferase family protein [Candidatus Omnitrophica bacterium]|nr:rRNA adenine N-6-methyltransferase family protein [Candidatus Omnitrophota bacterium]
MLEIINEVSQKRLRELDNFLSFIGIYEDHRRTQAFTRLLAKNRGLIRGKTGIEAGAGLGIITELLVKLGARKVFAVEENAFCCQFLRKKFKGDPRVEVVHERIERFRPRRSIDFLFQELYGGLLLDESLLALERIKFDPGAVIPDGGAILAEEVSLAQLKDPTVDRTLARLLDDALITDMFPYFRFRAPSVIGTWKFSRRKVDHSLVCKVRGRGGIIALGMEVRHGNARVTGTKECFNWPYSFTPVKSGKFRLSFKYRNGATRVYWKWL